MSKNIYRGKMCNQIKDFECKNYWCYGDAIVNKNSCHIHPKGNIFEMNGELAKLLIAHPVLPESICQFTGLTDKNGTEIFEKDIIKYTNEDGEDCYLSVGFKDGCFVYEEYAPDGTVFTDALKNVLPLEVEVVGNVIDNPELIQRK